MKKKGATVAIILTVFACIIITFIFFHDNKNAPIEVNYSGNNNSIVFPVLYFEENIGQLDYSTRTLILKNSKIKEMESHYRSFSKTYPVSALERIHNPTETYGQLLAYYRTSSDSIYLFDNSTAKNEKNRFTLLSNGNESYIEYSKDEYFFNFLWFNNQYYVFCLEQKDKSYDDYDTLNIYLFSDKLERTGSFNIDIAENNIKPYNFINKSFAINDGSVMFPVRIQQAYYYFVYDIETGKTRLLQKDYNPIGAISDKDIFYLVGHNENRLIIETVSSDGELLVTQTNDLSFTPNRLIDSKVNFDQILYMHDNYVYGSYVYLDTAYYFSYNLVDTDDFNVWKVTKKNNDLMLMNNKFVIYDENQFFDLIPNTNNDILY